MPSLLRLNRAVGATYARCHYCQQAANGRAETDEWSSLLNRAGQRIVMLRGVYRRLRQHAFQRRQQFIQRLAKRGQLRAAIVLVVGRSLFQHGGRCRRQPG